ncbi:MAG: hydrolase [Sphingomonadales bacterium]|nr:hydrolase [Sphingomonadales bacterium]
MSFYEEYLARIDHQHDEMLALVEKWALINSGSYNLSGLELMRQALMARFDSLGAEKQVLELDNGEIVGDDGTVETVQYGKALLYRMRPEANRRVLLTGHYDTVFAKDHAFQTVDWIDDDTLHGPGVADMKGGLVVMLTALQALEASPLATKIGYDILLSPDEEVGSIGSAPLLAKHATSANFGMTFEAALADGTLAGARKGSGNFTAVFHGKAAHAGREFDQGVNAVAHMARFAADLHDLNDSLDDVTINVAMASGGTALNVVADQAMVRFNMRCWTVEGQKAAEAAVQKLVEKAERIDGLSVDLHGGFTRPPKPMTPQNEKLFQVVKDCGQDLGIAIAWRPTGGCCEGNNLAAVGLANVDTLGVRGGLTHSAGEFAMASSFVERARLSALILMKYANGDFDIERETI